MSRTYDQWLTIDDAANDADIRREVCPACRVGSHEQCEVVDCECNCADAMDAAQHELNFTKEKKR